MRYFIKLRAVQPGPLPPLRSRLGNSSGGTEQSVSSGCVMRFSRSVTNCCWINWDFHGFDSPLLLGLVTVTAGVVLDFLA